MKRLASEVLRDLEVRIANLEKQSSGYFNVGKSSHPIEFNFGEGLRTEYLSLNDAIYEMYKLYTLGQAVPNKDGNMEHKSWDRKTLKVEDDVVIAQVKGIRGELTQTISKSDLCTAMCESGLLDDVIESFLKKQLKIR